MNTRLNNLENLFTAEEQKAFMLILVHTKKAIKDFEKQSTQFSSKFFEEKSDYSQEKNCIINLSNISNVLLKITNKSYNLIKPDEIIKTLADNLPKLILSLKEYEKKENAKIDKDTTRLKQFQNAINYMEKIQNCFTNPEHKADNPPTYSGP